MRTRRGLMLNILLGGEDAPISPRGLRDLRILIAVLIVPVGYLVYLAIRSVV